MIAVGSGTLSLEDFSKIISEESKVELSVLALKKIDQNFEFLKHFSAEKLIYGINTGFGPMAQYKVSDEKALQLQYNLIRSHCSGGGKCFHLFLSKALW